MSSIFIISSTFSKGKSTYLATSSDGAETLMDRIQSEEDESFEETYANKKMIEYALNKLPEPDKTTIYLYYMAGASRKDIAQKLNVSATQVSRILKRALNRLYNIIQNTLTDKEITKED